MSRVELCPRWPGERCRVFNCEACAGYETRSEAIQAQAASRLRALTGAADQLERRRKRRVAELLGWIGSSSLLRAADDAHGFVRGRCLDVLHLEIEAALVEHGQRLLVLHDAWLGEWAERWRRDHRGAAGDASSASASSPGSAPASGHPFASNAPSNAAASNFQTTRSESSEN